jgi:ACS family hexuronate transporter-like MFS transporter
VIRPLRWYIVALLFLSTVISYVDRQALSVNAPLIREEFHLSNTQYSQLVTAFLIGFTIGQPLMGWIIDRRGTRTGLWLAMLWWSAAGALHGIARGFGDLAVYRFLLGLGEGGAVPGSMRGIAEWFPQRERSFATGVFASGTTVGALISAPIIAFTTLRYGWRTAFVLTGACGLLWLIAWLWLYDLPERHPRIDPSERRMIVEGRASPSGRTRGWTFELLRHRKAWGIIAGRSIMDPVWWFYVFWLPSYLSDIRGFDLAAIGLFAWIPFLAAAGGTFMGGWWSGRLLRRSTLTRARKTLLLAGATGTLLGMPAARASEPWLCLLLISAVTFSIGLWATITLTLGADILPPDAVGSMTGLSGGAAAFVGIGFTLLIGWIVDRFSYWPVFVVAGTAPLVGFALLSTLIGEIRPIELVRAETETKRA